MQCILTFNPKAQLPFGFPNVHSDLQESDVNLDWCANAEEMKETRNLTEYQDNFKIVPTRIRNKHWSLPFLLKVRV